MDEGTSVAMKKRTSTLAAAALAFSIALIPAISAHAQTGQGYANCGSTWSFTRANSTQSLTHYHSIPGLWRKTTKPAGISTYKGFYQEGLVWMELSSPGNFSGAVYGCTA